MCFDDFLRELFSFCVPLPPPTLLCLALSPRRLTSVDSISLALGLTGEAPAGDWKAGKVGAVSS